MDTTRILFILFSAAAIILALIAAGIRRSERAVFSLAACLAAVSVIFALLELYIPAVLHLILSVGSFLSYVRIRKVIYINSEIIAEQTPWKRILPAAIISVSGAVITILTIINFHFFPSKKPDSDPGLKAFINTIFSTGKEGFFLPLILLVIIATAAFLVYRAVKYDRTEDKNILTAKKQHRNE